MDVGNVILCDTKDEAKNEVKRVNNKGGSAYMKPCATDNPNWKVVL